LSAAEVRIRLDLISSSAARAGYVSSLVARRRDVSVLQRHAIDIPSPDRNRGPTHRESMTSHLGPPPGISVIDPRRNGFRGLTSEPPVGAVLLWAGDNVTDLVVSLPGVLRKYPWCPVCLWPSGVADNPRLIAALETRPGIVAVVRPHLSGLSGAITPVERAISARPLPSCGDLAWYIGVRTGGRDIERLMIAAFMAYDEDSGINGRTTGSRMSKTTLWRRVSAFGPLSVREWQALARIIVNQPGTTLHSPERLALSLELDPRTFRKHLTRLMGCSFAHYATCAGWEVSVERVLRHHGYVCRDESAVG
jgi:hypothetical protein